MNHSTLTGGRVLARNAIFNLIGYAAPLLVAFIAVPLLIEGLGTERFGVLTLIFMAVGYFSLFDLGIGRATTKLVAETLARQEIEALPKLVWTSLGMLSGLGLSASLVLGLCNPLLVSRIFHIPAYLQEETSRAFYLVAASIPLVLGTAGTRGVLEAQQRFGLISAIKVPVSSFFFAAPLLVLPFSNSLCPITLALLGTRLVEFAAYAYFSLRLIPGIRKPHWPEISYVRSLLGFGGWLTVTNVVGPLMTYMDRFIVGGILTMTAVTYYATPYDFIARLAILPASILGVMFPALSASFLLDTDRFALLYERTLVCVVYVMTPVVLMLTVAAHPFLEFWIGPEFAAQSTLVFQLLALGALLNAVGQVSFSAIQAMGRPDLTAKIHLLELPLYLGMVWFLALRMGIAGAALACLIRIAADTAILYRLAGRMVPGKERQPAQRSKAHFVKGLPVRES